MVESRHTCTHLFQKLLSPAPALASALESRNAPMLHRILQNWRMAEWVLSFEVLGFLIFCPSLDSSLDLLKMGKTFHHVWAFKLFFWLSLWFFFFFFGYRCNRICFMFFVGAILAGIFLAGLVCWACKALCLIFFFF